MCFFYIDGNIYFHCRIPHFIVTSWVLEKSDNNLIWWSEATVLILSLLTTLQWWSKWCILLVAVGLVKQNHRCCLQPTLGLDKLVFSIPLNKCFSGFTVTHSSVLCRPAGLTSEFTQREPWKRHFCQDEEDQEVKIIWHCLRTSRMTHLRLLTLINRKPPKLN